MSLLSGLAQTVGAVIVTVALVLQFGWIGLVFPGLLLIYAGERWS